MFIRDILKCALKIKGYFLNIPKVWGGREGRGGEKQEGREGKRKREGGRIENSKS